MRKIHAVGACLLAAIAVVAALLFLSGTANGAPPQPYPTASTASASHGADPTSTSVVDPTTSTTTIGGAGSGGSGDASGGLSSTGVAVLGLGVLAVALIGVGGLLTFGGRRRPSRS